MFLNSYFLRDFKIGQIYLCLIFFKNTSFFYFYNVMKIGFAAFCKLSPEKTPLYNIITFTDACLYNRELRKKSPFYCFYCLLCTFKSGLKSFVQILKGFLYLPCNVLQLKIL
ncbi:MAG: hypothetical protein A2X70_06905 [Alphaproteobacteria bacterium GWC2_42_16]|nr:MAG: hypothetical protein A2X70_06905 [Alphaproteobacteria bacterium GWC2_42_16]OFW73773.1 MAG: hypothetical protein A2Z80_03130 [Alphaproteobacteria bacterium GWA2_41_27]OFW82034.1 MAG: hypothetical protein A3E50_01395 [Alphaproteobacteria bacterium RIFCSPHIGHO2_12_FULL_42_100]OFW85792.1 MAG: hypothetical protein A2W06_02775 [Alphaproteobacteria bacterium RBG_16_42_14]OFW91178.1 MAG: hypothetical protein A3C41_06920 [Alphaproteobacteria bacterium RIFCSPHIGHO2_02_FULL_42_30]OFW93253.1 MAG: 